MSKKDKSCVCNNNNKIKLPRQIRSTTHRQNCQHCRARVYDHQRHVSITLTFSQYLCVDRTKLQTHFKQITQTNQHKNT